MRSLFYDLFGFGVVKMIRWERMNECKVYRFFLWILNILLIVLFFGFGILIRRIVGVVYVEDFELIKEDEEWVVCERKVLEFGKMFFKERRKFKCIGEVVLVI